MGKRLDRLWAWLRHRERNTRFIDPWTAVHLVAGMFLGWVMDPFIALLILTLYEPLELLVLCPLFDRLFGIEFGFESLRNSLSDILFNSVGVALGFWLLRPVREPPFCLWC